MPVVSDGSQMLSSTSYYFPSATAAAAPVDSAGHNPPSEDVDTSSHLNHLFPNELEALLTDNVTAKCQEVTTLEAAPSSLMTNDHGHLVTGTNNFFHAFLTRRLGLIVGCCLGIIVFIVLISVLGWLKLKKQRIREESKRLQPMPPEFISYRHFSIPNDEQNRVVQQQQPPPSAHQHHSHLHHHSHSHNPTNNSNSNNNTITSKSQGSNTNSNNGTMLPQHPTYISRNEMNAATAAATVTQSS